MLIGGRAHNLEELYLVSEAQLDFVEINLLGYPLDSSRYTI
jgi:hypothetical protein